MIFILALPWLAILVLCLLVLRTRAQRRWHGPKLHTPKRRARSGSKFWNDPHVQ